MSNGSDPLLAPGKTSAFTSPRPPSLVVFGDHAPQQHGGIRRWGARGQNFLVDWLLAANDAPRDGAQWDIESEFEVMLLLTDSGCQIEHAADARDACARSVCVLPAGKSSLRLPAGGRCAMLRSVVAQRNCQAINEAAYQRPDARIASVGEPYKAVIDGDRVRVIAIDTVQASPEKPRLKMLQSASLSINWVEYAGPRDRCELSPHAHSDFEQGSLALEGEFVHHLRVPWNSNANLWVEDRHVGMGSPSLAVVPVALIHTSEGVGDHHHLLIDVFSPPRVDFIRNGWVANSGNYAPASR